MSSHNLADKSLMLAEASSGVRLDAGAPFALPTTPARWPPGRSLQILHLDLSLTLDPASPHIVGDCRVRLRTHAQFSGTAQLDLGSVKIDGLKGLSHPDLRWRHHEDKLWLDGLDPDTTYEFQLTYVGEPARGLYRTGPSEAEPDRPPMLWTQCQDVDGHHLFPCVDHPSHKQPMTVRAIVPEGLDVVGNGRLVSRAAVKPGWTCWTWEQKRPIPAYLFTLVVGPMVVHDDRSAVGAGVDGADVPVRYLAPQGTDPALLMPNFDKTPAMIEFCVRRLGCAYPFPRYDQVVVHDFIFGGMENAGATTLTDVALLPPEARVDGDMDTLVIHELAHQWFGDLVTCDDWSQAWLNEGWATYMEFVWATEDLGANDADAALFNTLDNYLGEFGARYQRALVEGRYEAPIDLFDRHLYEKGGLVLHTLRHKLGDEAFWSGVSAYLKAQSDGTAHTRDLQQALEQASGRSLERDFSEWVLGVGHPKLKLTLGWADGLLTMHATQTQSGDRIASCFALTLPVSVELADGTVHHHKLPLNRREQALALPSVERPVRVGVDPRFTGLVDLELTAPADWLVASLDRDEGVVGQIRAARALGRSRSTGLVDALATALHGTGHWSVRSEAAAQLAKVGGDRAQNTLIEGLQVGCLRTRASVARALGTFRGDAVQRALQASLVGPPASLRVHAELASAFGRSRAPGAVDVLVPLAASQTWASLLARKALEGLGATADVAAWPALAEATTSARTPAVRAAAASGLADLAGQCTAVAAQTRTLLEGLAAEAPFRVRLAAIAALGRLGDRGARATLHRIQSLDLDARTRSTAGAALRAIDSRSGPAGLQGVQDDLKRIQTQSDALIDRLAVLEAKASLP